MSYEVVTDEGPKGQFASNLGYSDLITKAEDMNLEALNQLFDSGESKNVSECIEELKNIKAPDDVAETAKTLAKLIDGAKEVMITDGVA